ncbi:hypothetical protein HPP92_026851 [Vanilla planifolia]|uniref:Nudix hydrolase domain-containing protein n=1 Tax=Vanilla planifolia TaxID=51239 RepID=A0A835U734_VANPL|nr:hypothetical protein HPP92_026851 [Vanilla planifolia]
MASTDSSNWGNIEVLKAVNDDHGGVIVELKAPMDPGVFSMCLKASLLEWRNQGIKGVWIKLPIELAGLVQHIVEEGFWYHHAEPSYLMLVHWIPATEHTIPVNATHRVGVGAFVVNDRKEILVVQEKSGTSRGLGFWKIPTGVINQGEDIFAGVVREVKEETGIDTEFVEVLAFRQSHNSFFEKSDLFFLCMLHPLSFDIQKQESEIEVAQWMPIEKYAAEPLVQRHEFSKHVLAVGLAKLGNTYAGFSPVCVQSSFVDQQSYIYLNGRDLEHPQATSL